MEEGTATAGAAIAETSLDTAAVMALLGRRQLNVDATATAAGHAEILLLMGAGSGNSAYTARQVSLKCLISNDFGL